MPELRGQRIRASRRLFGRGRVIEHAKYPKGKTITEVLDERRDLIEFLREIKPLLTVWQNGDEAETEMINKIDVLLERVGE